MSWSIDVETQNMPVSPRDDISSPGRDNFQQRRLYRDVINIIIPLLHEICLRRNLTALSGLCRCLNMLNNMYPRIWPVVVAAYHGEHKKCSQKLQDMLWALKPFEGAYPKTPDEYQKTLCFALKLTSFLVEALPEARYTPTMVLQAQQRLRQFYTLQAQLMTFNLLLAVALEHQLPSLSAVANIAQALEKGPWKISELGESVNQIINQRARV